MGNQLFTIDQVTKMLSVSRVTVWKMKKKGILTPSIHIGKRPRYVIEDIEKAIGPKSKEQVKTSTNG